MGEAPPPAYDAMPIGGPPPPIAEPLTYGYTPVYDAAPASIRAFGIDELKPEEHVPDKFEIIGTDMQLLRLHMEPGEMVVAEPGAMIYMSENVTAGCNSDDCWGRCVSCSPCIMATFEAEAADTYIALTPVRPAKVLPVPLKGRRFLAKDRAFFASLGQVEVNFDVDTNLLTCCCGGQGLIRQVLKGNGMVFMGAMGVITHKVLQPGETLLVDTNSLVAWEDSVGFGVESTGGLKNCCCAAGAGRAPARVEGPSRQARARASSTRSSWARARSSSSRTRTASSRSTPSATTSATACWAATRRCSSRAGPRSGARRRPRRAAPGWR